MRSACKTCSCHSPCDLAAGKPGKANCWQIDAKVDLLMKASMVLTQAVVASGSDRGRKRWKEVKKTTIERRTGSEGSREALPTGQNRDSQEWIEGGRMGQEGAEGLATNGWMGPGVCVWMADGMGAPGGVTVVGYRSLVYVWD
ncbi:uncharacterized protein B0T23DRAFT_169928 [Neurospora hispaniola]|uniref:Uncharacterized protein n=1 Tax=Neurospora hispaniola TaxID=588809 RepID=A0AAJ0I605_9PEZI|nr:hypothetical protein B0T23DRAFT_169928 [Neurospora hispaniola]